MLFLLYSFQSLSSSSLALIGHYEQSISKPHAVPPKILIKNQKLLQTLRLYQSLLSFKARLDRKERLNIARKSKRQDRGVLCCLRLGTQGSQDGGKKRSQVHKFYPWLLVQSLIHTVRRGFRRIAPRDTLKNVSQVESGFWMLKATLWDSLQYKSSCY
jgi:hypothetical protein